jgi:hypothetical protein
LLGHRFGRAFRENLVGFVQQFLQIFLERLPEAVFRLVLDLDARGIAGAGAPPPLPVASELVEICVLVDTVPVTSRAILT